MAGRRVTRWFLPPVCAWVLLLSSAVFCCLPGLTAVLASDDVGTPADSRLQFVSDDPGVRGQPIAELGPLREGHATLRWSSSSRATAYRLANAAGETLYRGHLPHAFVSGLPDGEHRFEVIGIDPAGNVVATAAAPIVVHVRHWDRRIAWALFAIGAVTVFILVVVLVIGSLAARDAAAGNDDGTPNTPISDHRLNLGDARVAAEVGEP